LNLAHPLQNVYIDPSQAAHAELVSRNSPGNNQLLYFTSSSLTSDGTLMYFISDRTGDANLFVRDMYSGKERQLSANAEGVLKAYVYFDGHPYRGFGKGSVSINPRTGTAYYIQGRRLCEVTAAGKARTLAELPPDQMTAFTHLSADGARLCVPTVDARALDGDRQLSGQPNYDIDARVRTENLSSCLRVYSTLSGQEILCEPVPQAWITHVQFCPSNPRQILYNHEWPSDCGIRRMWLWDGKQHLRLRNEGETRTRADWTCHEMWERDGKAIIYHGSYANGPYYIGRVNPDGSGLTEIQLPGSWKRYGHFAVGDSGQLVSDGYYEQRDDTAMHQCGAWISLLNVDWQTLNIQWIPLCPNESTWNSQDAHPHPVFDHSARAIYFTSDRTGKRAVYRVNVPSDANHLP